MNRLTWHPYSVYATEAQQVALYALNENLHLHEPDISDRIWKDRQKLQVRVNAHDDWINDTEYDFRMVFTWSKDAPEFQKNESPIACCLYDHYRNESDRTVWQSYQGWHNDRSTQNVYPVGGKHNIWFHGLYDHNYGDSRITWAQMSRLGGCYLDIKTTYQCLVSDCLIERVRDDTEETVKNSEEGARKRLNNLLRDYEVHCLRELIEQDQYCLSALNDVDHPLFDYDLVLSVWFTIPETSRFYHDETAGEVAKIHISCKGISLQPTTEMQSIGDGKNHNRRRDQRDLHKVYCFLFQALQERSLLTNDMMCDIDCVCFDIEVYRKEWAIRAFDSAVLKQKTLPITHRIM